MPAIFTTGDEASNPLFHDRRNNAVRSDALDRSFFGNKDLLPASRPQWADSFSVPLEFDPHGVVHSVIGGEMGRITTSARDPIFWLHHANIDRLWTSWLKMGDGRKNPPAGSTWAQQGFTFDKAGQLHQTAGAVTDSETGLGYRYDDDTPFPGAAPVSGPPVVMAQATTIQIEGAATQSSGGTVVHSLGTAANTTTVSNATALTLGNQSVALDMKVAPATSTQLRALALSPASAEVKSAWLVLENVEIGPDGRDGGFSFSVKATLPGGGPAVSLAELNTFNWPSDAASGGAHDHGALQPVTLTIPLQDVLAKLKLDAPSALAGGLRVVFEAAHPEAPGNPQFVKIGSVSIKTSSLAVQ
jgi:tyrosinase